MAIITIKQFGGIAPKIAASKLAPNMAQIAVNAKVWSGDLRPFKGAQLFDLLAKAGVIQTIYQYNAKTDFLEWTQDVSVARVAVAGDETEKIVFSGTDMPRITHNGLYDDASPGTFIRPSSYKLGIPKPTDTPTHVSGGAGLLTGAYTWVYTYVRKWLDNTTDEGPPSTASAIFTAAANDVDLTLPNTGAPTFNDFGITHKRIYRSVGGVYRFIAEIAVATTTYTDNITDALAGEELETTLYLSPPDTAHGAMFLENGVTAMFDKNTLYLSEPYRAHAYPLENQHNVPFPIVGIGQAGTTVIVCTTAFTWRFTGVDPAAMTPYRFPARLPCKSRRSIVSDQYGVRFVTDHGIVQVTPTSMTLATEQLEDKESWERFVPAATHCHSYSNGIYVGFYKVSDTGGIHTGGGFMFDQSANPPVLIDLGYYAYAAHAPVDGSQLFVVQKDPITLANTVYEWDALDTAYLEYTYRSKIFPMQSDDVFVYGHAAGDYGAGLTAAEQVAYLAERAALIAANQLLLDDVGDEVVNGIEVNGWSGSGEVNGHMTGWQDVPPAAFTSGSVSFRVYRDGVLVVQKDLFDDEPFVLPQFDLGIEYEVEVSGQVTLREATIAGDLEEIGQT